MFNRLALACTATTAAASVVAAQSFQLPPWCQLPCSPQRLMLVRLSGLGVCRCFRAIKSDSFARSSTSGRSS